MTRLIDADALKEPLTDEYKKLNDVFNETSVFKAPNDVALYGALMQEVGAVIGAIDEAPTVDAVPAVHGRWQYGEDESGYDGYYCSKCFGHVRWYGKASEQSITFIEKYNYCPFCGARMDDNG